jgi:hypothetical protein
MNKTMPSLPSVMEAMIKADDGLAAATEHSGPEWLTKAKDFLHDYCANNSSIFCDEVWDAGLPRPESPRAFGSVIKHAIKHGWMESTGEARPSRQSNMGLRMVYRSLLIAHAQSPEEQRVELMSTQLEAMRNLITEFNAMADQLDEQGPQAEPPSADNGWLHKYELAANATRWARDKIESVLN